MNEAAKTQALLTDEERACLTGKGIDIGSGASPINSSCQCFDQVDGDANRITDFISDLESFDYVVSFHCLEHMHAPEHALPEWWKLVRRGGVMIIAVPDEDLYEQGYWPSLFNRDHKVTFAIGKSASWSPVSRNLDAMARALPDAEILSVRLQDRGYDRRILFPGAWPRWLAKLCYMVIFRLDFYIASRRPWFAVVLRTACRWLRLPVDQTLGNAVAQILLVARKT